MQKIILPALALGLSLSGFSQADSAAVYLQKGLDEKARGRRMESLKQFEKAYGFNGKDQKVVQELAAAYLDLRRYALAREKYVQLEGLGDRSDSTYRQLMQLSFNLRQFDDAIKYAGSLKTVSPGARTALIQGKAYWEKEDLGNAIRFLEQAAREEPANADIPYTIARAYTDMQNYKSSLPYWLKAVELNPSQNRWLYELSLVYYALNDNNNSLKYILEAGDKGYKKDNEYLNNLATAYLNAGKFPEGIAVLEEIRLRRPSDQGIIHSLAEAHYNFKKYDEAMAYYDELLRADTKNAEALYMIGMCYQRKGEKAKGMQLCDKAIEMDPSLQGLRQKKEMPGF